MTHHIVYHNDLDGIVSAWQVYEYLKATKQAQTTEVRFHPVMHPDFPDDIWQCDNVVWFLDYTPEKDKLLLTYELCANVIWIDHHKPVYEKLSGSFSEIPGLRDDSNCAAVLTYKYINSKTGYKNLELPKMLSFVNTFDLHIKNEEFRCALAFHEYIQFNGFPPPYAHSFWRNTFNELQQRLYAAAESITIGHTLLNYKKRMTFWYAQVIRPHGQF